MGLWRKAAFLTALFILILTIPLMYLRGQAAADSAWIAYICDNRLCWMQADGSDPHELADYDLRRGYLSWSPDGQWIYFIATVGLNDVLFRINPITRIPQRLTSLEMTMQFPRWSPDGQWLAFAARLNNNWDVYRLKADGSQRVRVTNHTADDWEPSWSPDGQWLAFVSLRDLIRSVYRMRIDGSEIVRLTPGEVEGVSTAWSPDGAWVVLSSANGGLYRVAPDGSQLLGLLDRLVGPFEPVWSPDGQAVIVLRQQNYMRVPLDGSETHLLNPHADSMLVESSASLAPDKHWVAFAAWQPLEQRNTELYRIHPDGNSLERLTSDSLLQLYPAWSGAGHWIYFTGQALDVGSHIYRLPVEGGPPQRLTDSHRLNTMPHGSPVVEALFVPGRLLGVALGCLGLLLLFRFVSQPRMDFRL